MTVQFQILGPLEVRGSIRSITPQPAKIRSLTALLCVKAGAVVSRDFLFDALWAGNPPRTARTALQVYVSKLRKHLDEHGGFADRLVTRPHGYALELETVELDLRQFESLAGRAKAAQAAGHADEALSCWQAACGLWRGPALADLRGQSVFDNLARQLDEKRIDALEQRIALELDLGRNSGVVSELYGLVAEYPLWENVHAQLMLALYRSGRVAEALQVYHKIRDALVRELGLEPGERIQRLHRAVLVRDPQLDPRPLAARAA
ncbi:BTAD domain-containing putative transcriptional regulator [Streptomyces sp. NPDC018610]|uniref:AfsR/SARP family transcriptional regulator n=1 Tax=Streptomyces sp. NPDC018610 TaxID=3365049 RepID=UPI00379882B2